MQIKFNKTLSGMVEKKIYCLVVLLLGFSMVTQGQMYQTEEGYAEFIGYTPLFSFKGSSNSLRGSVNLADSTVNFELPIITLDTGNNKRNRDMMKLINVEKYPLAKFEGKIITPFRRDTPVVQEVKIKGIFTVHGVSQVLTIPGTMHFTGNGLEITAEWSQKLTTYDIDPPSVLFYSMKDEQDIQVKAILQPAEASN
jgi:polyisoprenoid-binding protein YceI